jgi:hypothetical protein
MKVETYKGITTEKRVKPAGKKLHKTPKRKKPKFDFEEGIYTGMLAGFLTLLQEGLEKSFSGQFTVLKTIFKSKAMLKKLVEDYSYSYQEIFDIMTGTGITNPIFLLEYVMSDGKPKERICEVENCPTILTPSTMLIDFKCTRHREEDQK